MRFISTTDLPLGPHGRMQSDRLREALQNFAFERCLVSPMRRCLETREIVAPDVPFEIEPALREVDFGAWEGQTLEWVEHHAPALLAQRRQDPVTFRPPDGESIEDAAARLAGVAQRLRNANGTLVVAHRLTLGILERLLRDLPLGSRLVTGLEPATFRVVDALAPHSAMERLFRRAR